MSISVHRMEHLEFCRTFVFWKTIDKGNYKGLIDVFLQKQIDVPPDYNVELITDGSTYYAKFIDDDYVYIFEIKKYLVNELTRKKNYVH